MQIAIAADHAGFCLKKVIFNHISSKNLSITDFGTHYDESCDYPYFAHNVANKINCGKTYNLGILICGSGNGMSMVANKYKKVRASLCWTEELASLAKKHNNANILVLPARFIDGDLALKIIDVFMETEFEGGRHQERLDLF